MVIKKKRLCKRCKKIVRHYHFNKNSFCSRSCYLKFIRNNLKRIERKCLLCHNIFKFARILRNHNPRFCSVRCRGKAITLRIIRRRSFKGKNNPMFGKRHSSETKVKIGLKSKKLGRIKHILSLNKKKKRFGRHNPNLEICK